MQTDKGIRWIVIAVSGAMLSFCLVGGAVFTPWQT